MHDWPSLRRAVRQLLHAPSPAVDSAEPTPEKTIIVRRGLSDDFYFFLEVFARHNSAAMVVDRRKSERRHFSREAVKERRHSSDRRGADAPWSKESFLVGRKLRDKN